MFFIPFATKKLTLSSLSGEVPIANLFAKIQLKMKIVFFGVTHQAI